MKSLWALPENRISAKFEYEWIDQYTCGVVLEGTEVKSIRSGKISFNDSYCMFMNDELFLRSFHISEYELGTHDNHNPKRDRKESIRKGTTKPNTSPKNLDPRLEQAGGLPNPGPSPSG